MLCSVVSTVVRLGEVAYYMRQSSIQSSDPLQVVYGGKQVAEPSTLLDDGSLDQLDDILNQFTRFDDVWCFDFMSSVIIQTMDANFSLTPDAKDLLRDRGACNIYIRFASDIVVKLSQGPYFLHHGELCEAYRLYPDTTGAFVVATVPADNNGAYQAFDGCAYGEQYPSTLTIAVPSRLYYRKTESRPFAGSRLAVKDVIDLKGLKTGASSRAYTMLYPARVKNAQIVQRCLDLGFVIIGKLKSTQFADSEWPTCDWIDYHAPFNPRGDGYLTTSGSSAGSAAAVASYPWLDFSLGTDTLGSTRAPAAAQGIFGMRPSLGVTSFEGVIRYSPKFDTIGAFARTASELRNLARALYTPSTDCYTAILKKKPTKILYPTDYWPVSDGASQGVFDAFISRLEQLLGVKRTAINLDKLWSEHNPEGVDIPLKEYFAHAFEWAANPDQWTGFFNEFLEEYESAYGKPPVLNPQLRFKRDYLPTITTEQQSEAVRRLDIYKTWFYHHVMPNSNDGYSSSVLVLPWTDGEPDYRDKYRDGPQKFTGAGFFLYNVGTYAEAPEIIIPVGTTPYQSKYTGITERLPTAIGLVGAKGSDVMLAHLASAVC